MTEAERAQYITEKIKTIPPGDPKIAGVILQDVLLVMNQDIGKTSSSGESPSGKIPDDGQFVGSELDGNNSITIEHTQDSEIPYVILKDENNDILGEIHYTKNIVDNFHIKITINDDVTPSTVYKWVVLGTVQTVNAQPRNYLEYLLDFLENIVGETYSKQPVGWIAKKSVTDDFSASLAIEFIESISYPNSSLKFTKTGTFTAETGAPAKMLYIENERWLKAGEEYTVEFDYLKEVDENVIMLIGSTGAADWLDSIQTFNPGLVYGYRAKKTITINPTADGKFCFGISADTAYNMVIQFFQIKITKVV